jgi:hypothetical protein
MKHKEDHSFLLVAQGGRRKWGRIVDDFENLTNVTKPALTVRACLPY